MGIWEVLLVTDGGEDKTIEVEAETRADAIKKAIQPGFSMVDVSRVRGKHGGYRPGSGQPRKFGELTKTVRIPISLAEKRDLISKIPELQQLLLEAEEDCLDNPNSARRYYLVKLLKSIRELGFLDT